MRTTVAFAVAALLAIGACSDDAEVQVVSGNSTSSTRTNSTESARAAEARELDGSSLTVEDSCGTSFTVRNSIGTKRLTISPSQDVREGGEPGVFDLGEGGWTGELEVGLFLDVWPCHDVGSDFDREQVMEVWTVVGGSVELIDPIPVDTDGGGGAGEVRARITEMTLELPDGRTGEMADIDLVNSRWGFSGG